VILRLEIICEQLAQLYEVIRLGTQSAKHCQEVLYHILVAQPETWQGFWDNVL